MEEDSNQLPQPKRSLGQNFLTSEGAFELILMAGDVKKDEVVLEIGPGRGALTRKLLEKGALVVAIEKDKELIPYLKDKFSTFIEQKNLILLHKDALKIDPGTIHELPKGYKIVANIPYYITGAFFRKYLAAKPQPSTITVLVQKEVALRITARTNKESLLSLSIKAYGTPKYIGTVKRGSFFPAPNVDSAILHISSISKDFFTDFYEILFFEAIKAGFAQKRKLLKNNLKAVADEGAIAEAFAAASIPENVRAEDLTLEQWKAVVSSLSKQDSS